MARKRKPRPTSPLLFQGWVTTFISERVPLNCAAYDPDVNEKVDALGKEFARTHAYLNVNDPHPLKVLDVLLPWVRARGYPLLDEPVCPYATYHKEAAQLWGPPLQVGSPESNLPQTPSSVGLS